MELECYYGCIFFVPGLTWANLGMYLAVLFTTWVKKLWVLFPHLG